MVVRHAAKAKKVLDGEKLRRLRLGCFTRLFRHRYGRHLPNDDAGTEDLWLLIQNVSLVPFDWERRVRNTIETWAPWMNADQIEDRICALAHRTTAERTPSAEELGIKLNITNDERVALRLWWFKPVDMTDRELDEWRKQRKRDLQAARRKSRGTRTRQQYRADIKARPKPWEVHNISRASWFRLKRQNVRFSVKQINSKTHASHLVLDSQKAESQRRGCHESGLLSESVTQFETSENIQRMHQAPCALASNRVSQNQLSVALEKLGRAIKEKDGE